MKQGKRILTGILFIIGIVVGWYVVVRLISPWTVVKTLTLQPEKQVTSLTPFTTLRVGCYNIAHGRGGRFGATEWEGGNRAAKIERLKQIAVLLQAAQLDVVVLNEVDFASIWSGHVNQARMIAQEAGYAYLVEQRNLDMAIPFVRVCFGNAILSRYPLSDATFLDYPNTSEFAEMFTGGFKEGVIATVHLPDASRIQVAAIHLSVNSEPVRIASVRMILEHYRKSALPLIAMGDFNTAPRGYPQFYEDAAGQNAVEIFVADQQFTTLPQGLPLLPKDLTFPSEKPDRVIDWIVVSTPWNIVERTVISSDLSDHLPVTAVLVRDQSPL